MNPLSEYLDMLEPGRRTALSAGLVLTPTGLAPQKAGVVASRTAYSSTNFAPRVAKAGTSTTPTISEPVLAPTGLAPPKYAATPAATPATPTCSPGSFWNGMRCVVSFIDSGGGGGGGGGGDVPAEMPCPSDTFWDGTRCAPSLIVPPVPETKSTAPFWLGLLAVALVAKKYL